jgi:tRNA(Phe) wybutosine-synthesizing methylase Tyw3
MIIDSFSQAKKDTLSREDKSSIGKWDEKIIKLCEKINKNKNHYTTSSCSGRVLLMVDKEKKGEGLFLKVWHDEISFKELKKELEKLREIVNNPTHPPANLLCSQSSQGLIKNISTKKTAVIDKSIKNCSTNNSKVIAGRFNKNHNKINIKFKQEPFIIHIACKDINCGKKILHLATKIGIKRAGIIGISEKNKKNEKVVVELNGSEKLEFPIVVNGKIIVDDEFLKIIVNRANKKLKRNWEIIERLEKSL